MTCFKRNNKIHNRVQMSQVILIKQVSDYYYIIIDI